MVGMSRPIGLNPCERPVVRGIAGGLVSNPGGFDVAQIGVAEAGHRPLADHWTSLAYCGVQE